LLSGCGAAGAGVSTFLAMGRGKAHASEIEAGSLEAGANSLCSRHICYGGCGLNEAPSAEQECLAHYMRSGLLLVVRVNIILRQHRQHLARGHSRTVET
jgi:hypothetical protein